MGEAQAYVQQSIVQLGWPLKPSLHEKEEFKIGSYETTESKKHQIETFALLSKDMRARRFSEAELYYKQSF